ncbi:outer membrane protein TolC [Mangrovibacterium marinum]|uniref:Outer membrane protein TolC n=1 Tax=Mangrovibacterium marinum TaxID=1639118 RepID=A0A2T5C4E9_9BACT|nr:TolC family protein [Mangrovibacterium marinum]PTN09742.1 outer membrane protein TolC [Mangrovibacterium marinum]
MKSNCRINIKSFKSIALIKGMGSILLKGMLLLFVSFSPLPASAQHDLDKYMQVAAENNPGLKASFNEYMAALETVPQVRSLPDPQVMFGYFINPVETRNGPMNFKIAASQMFPWFGTLRAKGDVATEAAKAKYEMFLESKAKLFNEVRSTYFNLYFTNAAIAVTTDNLELLSSLQRLALIKVEAGMSSLVDEYRIEMEIGDLENQLALLRDKLLAQQVMFNKLLNRGGQEQISLPDTLWDEGLPYTKATIRDSILTQNHQLLSLDMQQEALQYKQEAARKEGMPKIMLGLDYTIIGKGANNMSGKDALVLPQVGITIPLYRNKYRSMINEVVYQQTAKANEKLNKSNVLETVFEGGWKDFQDADRRITLNQNQAKLARMSIDLLETEYSNSGKNFEEILRMERKLLMYRLELEKARSDKQAAVSFINYLMGK